MANALNLQPDEIEVFRAGTYPQGEYSESDIAQIAKDYDPTNEHRGFIGVDPGYKHGGKNEGRAYGLFSSLRAAGASLIGKLADGVPQPVKDAFSTGEVNGWSAEIWPEYRFNDGRLGKYFKGIKLLGVTPPQIKGLKAAFDFSDEDHGRVDRFEYSTAPYAPESIADVLKADETRRELNDIQWAFQRQADRVMCATDLTAEQKRAELNRLASELANLTEVQVESYQEEPVADPKSPTTPAPTPGDPAQFAELQAQFAELKKQNDALEARNKASDELITKIGRENLMARISAFSEQATKDGKLSKGDAEAGVAAFMEAIEPVYFELAGKDGKTEKVGALAWFQAHVDRRIAAVPTGVKSAEAKAGAASAPAEFSADTDLSSQEFSDQVDAYAAEHKIGYREAYKACVDLALKAKRA